MGGGARLDHPTRALLLALAGAVLALAGWGTLRRITWYVATLQHANLTFARDLAHGAVFHHSAALDALADLMPARTDAMAQTYVWDHGRLYSRYAPGFPLLLAGTMRLFGEDAVHYVNPALFLMLLVVLMAIGHRLLRSAWLGAAVPALVLLTPTRTPWWAFTPTNDVAAHLAGLIALYLAIVHAERRLTWLGAATLGFALGYAVSIRPDTALYAIPIALILAMQRRTDPAGRPHASWGTAALAGLLLGMLPFLSYNWLVSGNPLRSTQAMELEEFWTPAAAATHIRPQSCGGKLWCSGVIEGVQGGGLRATNLPRVLPENLRQIRSMYGDALLGAAAFGALLSTITSPVLFVATVPYVLAALLFFGCWGRPDHRFLMGLDLLLPLLVLQGTIGLVGVVGRLVERGLVVRARLLALVGTGACATAIVFAAGPSSLTTTNWISGWISARWVTEALTPMLLAYTMVALLAASVGKVRGALAMTAPVLLMSLVGLIAVQVHESRNAPFQRMQVDRARATWAAASEPPAVVITSEDIGRPAENIEHYTRIPALYLTDLERWRLSLVDVTRRLIERGMHPYLVIGQDARSLCDARRAPADVSRRPDDVDSVADRGVRVLRRRSDSAERAARDLPHRAALADRIDERIDGPPHRRVESRSEVRTHQRMRSSTSCIRLDSARPQRIEKGTCSYPWTFDMWTRTQRDSSTS